MSHRNYRLFFGGQGVSLVGTWMQQIALNWLVFRLSHSAFLLGVVGFTGRIPTFLLTSMAGVLADRWNRHRILVITQSLATVQALTLAILILTDKVAVWHVIVLNMCLGIINAVDVPTRQAFVSEMVERREDLSNAIALNSSLSNSSRLIGPSLAGILTATLGEGLCFLLNAISFLAVIAALLAMKVERKKQPRPNRNVFQELKEGFSYAFGFPPIRSLLLLLALVSLMGMPYMVLMPIFAGNILNGGPRALGFLLGMSGAGALIGAVFLASRKTVLGLGKIIVIASAIFGIGLLGFSFSRIYWLSLFFMMPTGFGMMVQTTSTNTVLQTLVDEDKRGRVMSFHAMAIIGMVPFGSLMAGSLASHIGAPNTVMIGGISCLIGSFLFGRRLPALRKMGRPIYVERGVIEEAETSTALKEGKSRL